MLYNTCEMVSWRTFFQTHHEFLNRILHLSGKKIDQAPVQDVEEWPDERVNPILVFSPALTRETHLLLQTRGSKVVSLVLT